MIVKPLKFIQIDTNSDHIYGLTAEGEVWYRTKIPYSSSTYQYSYTAPTSPTRKEEVKKEEESIWKPLKMVGYVNLPLPEEKTCSVISEENSEQKEEQEEIRNYYGH